MRIALASDHAGFRYKSAVAQYLRQRGHDVVDFGTDSEEPVDYPDLPGTRVPGPPRRSARQHSSSIG